MAKVIIDCNATSMEWFREIITLLANSDSVIFVVSTHEKYINELKMNSALMNLIKRFNSYGDRVQSVTHERLEHWMGYLEDRNEWRSCSACDDPWAFALVREKSVRYIFSSDSRMANCRDRIRPHIDSRFCRFVIISTLNSFNDHQVSILR